MTDIRHFPPTLAAAHERLAAVDPDVYARTRNSLTGGVSGLSPYITHGFVTLPEIVRTLADRHPLDLRHKFVYELGWREYSQHLWHRHGDGIFRSLHRGVLADADYAPHLPDDLREGRTGVPAIDRAVRTLYEVGYLHNHVRMWLASYVIHVRKVGWRAGADWMFAHLLDGDLGSNHLNWQWVAGTASSKPYLFNADNVARFAPPEWHSPGTVIDTTYEALDALARTPDPRKPIGVVDPIGLAEPVTLCEPPAGVRSTLPDAATIAGRDVWLVHPWTLRAPPKDLPADTLPVGVFVAEFHRQWPWSPARWQFVGSRMADLTPCSWYADQATLAHTLRSARSVHTIANPHAAHHALPSLKTRSAVRLFAHVDAPCDSFSQWWSRVTQQAHRIDDLPGMGEV